MFMNNFTTYLLEYYSSINLSNLYQILITWKSKFIKSLFLCDAGVACGYTSPLQGIARYAKTVHQSGCNGVACPDNQLFGRAETAARNADATVLVMGLDQSIEAEFKDRVGLLLPGHQQELVSRVATASRGPVVLVLMSGGPLDVSFAKNDPRVSAILWVGYPGQAGGTAIADVLFGRTNPGTRHIRPIIYTCYQSGRLFHSSFVVLFDPTRSSTNALICLIFQEESSP